MHKFTVIWGNIADAQDKRLDFVETEERSLDAVMRAARAVVQAERISEGYYADDDDTEAGREQLENDVYDGFAIFDGHLVESDISFC